MLGRPEPRRTTREQPRAEPRADRNATWSPRTPATATTSATTGHQTGITPETENSPAAKSRESPRRKNPTSRPIPGTRRRERLDENLGAADLELSDGDLAEVDRACAEVPVVGVRYPEAMQRWIDR